MSEAKDQVSMAIQSGVEMGSFDLFRIELHTQYSDVFTDQMSLPMAYWHLKNEETLENGGGRGGKYLFHMLSKLLSS